MERFRLLYIHFLKKYLEVLTSKTKIYNFCIISIHLRIIK